MSETFVKHDTGKLQWHLLPLSAARATLRAFMYGSEKYGEGNWEKTKYEEIHRWYNATFRHLTAHKDGEWLDDESKLPHLAHAASCALIYLALELRKRGDIFK